MKTVIDNAIEFEEGSQNLVYFSADWCVPCHRFKPVVEEFSSNNSAVTVHYVDVDGNPDLSERYQVMAVPSVVAVDKDLNEIGRFSGATDSASLDEFVNKVFGE